MPDAKTFKLFIGNVSEKSTVPELQQLFEKYGTVAECDIIKNFGFVHMETEEQGRSALRNLNGYLLNENIIRVEAAKNLRTPNVQTTKIFIGNLSKKTRKADICQVFRKYGTVVECDVIRNYGFVHLECFGEIMSIIKDLNGLMIDGRPIKVQVSTSRVRTKPGMNDPEQCYRCGRSGHWSRECPRIRKGARRLRVPPPPPFPSILPQVALPLPSTIMSDRLAHKYRCGPEYHTYFDRREMLDRRYDRLTQESLSRRDTIPGPAPFNMPCNYNSFYSGRLQPRYTSLNGASDFNNLHPEDFEANMISMRGMRRPNSLIKRYAPY